MMFEAANYFIRPLLCSYVGHSSVHQTTEHYCKLSQPPLFYFFYFGCCVLLWAYFLFSLPFGISIKSDHSGAGEYNMNVVSFLPLLKLSCVLHYI